MSAPIIQIENVTKSYKIGGSLYSVLNRVSLTINNNEFVCITGPSGSGKSTLLNLIAGIDRPTEGKILVEGIDLALLKNHQLATYRQSKVGIIFQNFNLLANYSTLENTNMALVLSGIDNKEGKKKSVAILKWIGLESRMGNKPTELSGGEQQRVAIARALIKNPKIILADEPTGNLDTKTGAQIIDLIKSLKTSGKTIVTVTHSQEVADKADRVIKMIDGNIVV